jgi:short-subunit dehydrogenase
MNSLEHKKIIVTGAGSGIGLAIIELLYPNTQELLAVDISLDRLQQLRQRFPKMKGLLRADLSQKSGVEKVISWVGQHWKQVDFCFANAGKAEFGPFDRQDWKTMEELFQLNVFSPIQLGLDLKKSFAGPHFRHVVTCSAMAYWSVPGYSAYSSTKAAVLRWAETVWSERDGDWLSLAFPIATNTAFFEEAGEEIPKAFPIQSSTWVAQIMIRGAIKGKKKIHPSLLFQLMLWINARLGGIRQIYQQMELVKFRGWIVKQTQNQ